MRTLNALEINAVAGGGLWTTIKKVWHDVENYFSGNTGSGNQACTALGHSLGALGHVAGGPRGGAEMGHAGTVCNDAANIIQQGLNRQRQAIAAETRGDPPPSASTSGR